ncbi:hypothetical protein D915_002994 [Fasciola hepatica]|uniref:U3 small nucleolar RNA-associated protein 18 n=1 Tax=Fasciola hepatica TaxID=6192 RepID=A0A4E0RC13_FASHE|nr:hypothetical protein D915_002994 [Fasciola hepatica]
MFDNHFYLFFSLPGSLDSPVLHSMLRFARKSKPLEEKEFEIVRSCEPLEYSLEPSSSKRESVSEHSSPERCAIQDSDLKPAWTDDDGGVVQEDYCPISVLDIRNKIRKRTGDEVSDSGDDDSDAQFSVRCTTKILRDDKSAFLPDTNVIEIRRVFDANRERISMASISSVDFNSAFQMLLTASEDSTLAMFKVDGQENALLRDRVFEKFPLSSAKFTVQGDRIVLTGNTNNFRLYDLQTGTETRAASFIGSTFEEILTNCQVSARQPNLVALQNSANKVYLADLRSLEKVSTLQARGRIQSYCFAKEGTLLYTLDASGTVFVFDLRSKSPRMTHQWVDEASIGGAAISGSPDGQWIACGLSLIFSSRLHQSTSSGEANVHSCTGKFLKSDSGFVNVYPSSKVIQSTHPHPDKSIANLRSRVNLVTFHPSNEMLCIGSSEQPAAIRLYHMHGRRVFDNFPVRVGRLGVASSIAFSPGGKYMSVGQGNGRAALYSIAHYPNY